MEADVLPTSTPDVTLSRATLSAPTPGRLMMVAYDADYGFNDVVTVSQTGATFPASTSVETARGGPDSSSTVNLGPWGVGEGPFTYYSARGPQLLFLYAGPTAVGTLDLEIRVDG